VEEIVDELASFDVRAWSFPDPDGRLGAVVAKRAHTGAPASANVFATLGDTGAASPLLGGATALDTAGPVAIVATGGGRTTGVLITADAPVPGAAEIGDVLGGGRAASYAEVLRARGQLVPGGETIPMGVPPESAMFVRGADEMLGLLGGRCVDCGTISTPPSIHPHCIACGGPKLEPVALARSGQVHTYVVNYTMPAPFVAPLPIAVLDMDDGARLMLQVVGDGKELAIGTRVELVLRKYAHERGIPVYGFKAREVRA
jgi:hydroxymethylglutaryl-CoA synthase